MMGRRWFGTLKARLMALWAVTIAACVLGVTLMLLQRVEQRSVRAVTELEAEHVGSLAGVVGQRVVGMQRTLRLFAQQIPVTAWSHDAVARTQLAGNAALSALFDTTFIADATGQVLALQDGGMVTTPLLDLGARDYFMRTVATGLPVVSSPIRGQHSHSTVLMFTVPVLDAHRNVVGVAGGSIRLAERNLLDDLTYTAGEIGNGTFTVITDAAGTIVSHPRRERIGEQLDTEPRLAAMAARWQAQGRPVEPSADVQREDGHFVAAVGVPAAEWMLFRTVPERALLGDMAQARREAIASAAAVALGGALLMLAALAHQLGPLKRLRQRALRMNDDTLAADAGWPDAHGEIGDLSRVLRQSLGRAAELGRERDLRLQQMRSVLANAPIGISITRDRRYELVSAEFCAIVGYEEAELIGRAASEMFASAQDYAELGPRVAAAFAARKPYHGEIQFRRRDGQPVWCELQGQPVEPGRPDAGTIWLLEDITERRAERERLSWSASHDMLTRLLNRTAFEQRLTELLAMREPRGTAALLMLDLDHFKQVNDNAGHAAGDDVLRQVAAVLHEHVRGADAAARLGGDEFALLLPGCDAAAGLALAERLLRAVATVGVVHEGRRLGVGLSVGVLALEAGHAGTHALTAQACMARADAALYEAKRGGRGRACVAADDITLHGATA